MNQIEFNLKIVNRTKQARVELTYDSNYLQDPANNPTI